MRLTPDAFAEMVVDAFKRVLEDPKRRIADLEQRLAALESKPVVKFCGVHQEGRSYRPGDACTRQGALWICRAATAGVPGDDHESWTLAVKRR